MPTRRKRTRTAVARTAVTVRIPLEVEARFCRLMEQLDLPAPQIFALGLEALEAAQPATESAAA
jgi:hypothetical protein